MRPGMSNISAVLHTIVDGVGPTGEAVRKRRPLSEKGGGTIYHSCKCLTNSIPAIMPH